MLSEMSYFLDPKVESLKAVGQYLRMYNIKEEKWPSRQHFWK